jgi:hypothetical protein
LIIEQVDEFSYKSTINRGVKQFNMGMDIGCGTILKHEARH